MRLALVILSHAQDKYLPSMLDAINSFDEKPSRVMIMLDRPGIKEHIITKRCLSKYPDIELHVNSDLPAYAGRPQMLCGEEYFLSGYMRNIAIGMIDWENTDGVIFIDGDCIPERGLISGHAEALKYGGLSVGKRCERKWLWNDQREMKDDSLIPIFGKEPMSVTNEWFIVDSGVVWTCNVGLSKNAVMRLSWLNHHLYGRYEVFSTDFCGTWGGEDGFLGMECFYTGIPIYTVSHGAKHIRHQDHERPLRKYDHMTFMDYLEWKREELIYLIGVNGGNTVVGFRPKNEIKNMHSKKV